jgi:hypothetical protein
MMRVPPTSIADFATRSKDPSRDLLNHWFSLSEDGRKQKFADTARAAQFAGVSRRTIPHWIDAGFVASIPVGRKHQVQLDSLKKYLQARVDVWGS